MKCRKCGETAVINMRQHKLALCGDHFLEWLPEQVQRFIEKYEMFTHDDRILMAVSGGKDSLGLWDILNPPGLQGRRAVHRAGHRRRLWLFGPIARTRRTVCRRQRPEAARGGGGAGLWRHDPRAGRHQQPRPWQAVLGVRPEQALHHEPRGPRRRLQRAGDWPQPGRRGGRADAEHPELGRGLPGAPGAGAAGLAADGLARKVKPLCRVYEREMAAYAIVRGIDYIYDECPHAIGSTTIGHKELLNQMEEKRPGAKLQFYLSFLQAKEARACSRWKPPSPTCTPASQCGQPTSAPGECSFCRLWDKVRTVKGLPQRMPAALARHGRALANAPRSITQSSHANNGELILPGSLSLAAWREPTRSWRRFPTTTLSAATR